MYIYWTGIEMKDEEIKLRIIRKLHIRGCWGTHHTSESNLQKGFPSHLRGKILDLAEELRKEGLLVKHPTHHEAQWNLNWDKKLEIEKMLGIG